MYDLTIKNAVSMVPTSETHCGAGKIAVCNSLIAEIPNGETPNDKVTIDASGCYVISGSITGISYSDLVKGTMPYMIALIIGVILITFIPQVVLWLPSIMYG